ncbi:GTPase IMAP family member 8 [Oncorhynchus nerka]|uniref:GTPase IMAP family member 8 n=1 Tax=Oncorhynchus nerka TaxID=8023 RepID=UPI0031B86717
MAASGLHTPSGDYLHLSELRIVLLGYRVAGKTSSGNTILGREEFDLRTAVQCVKRQGEVAGRHLTVVDTPGWWANHPLENTHELLKQEIVLSVSLCPPGPHTFLLVIDVDDSFTEEYRKAVEEHLELLSEKVWSHTIVLFTHGDFLGDTAIDQHIERQGKALQWLVEKCGNRYHVFNNKSRGDSTQITELLNNIEETVAGNRGGHYEIKGEILLEIEEKRKAEEESAKQRLMKVQEQRKTLRSLMGDSLHLSELRIVLLGSRDAGKSSAGNTILGREEFDLRTAAQCVKRQGEVAGRQVTVVDTPGWWKNLPVEYTPELVKQEIVFSASLCPPGPHTLFLVIRVDVSFKEEETNAAEDHLELLSERVWSHTIGTFFVH